MPENDTFTLVVDITQDDIEEARRLHREKKLGYDIARQCAGALAATRAYRALIGNNEQAIITLSWYLARAWESKGVWFRGSGPLARSEGKNFPADTFLLWIMRHDAALRNSGADPGPAQFTLTFVRTGTDAAKEQES